MSALSEVQVQSRHDRCDSVDAAAFCPSAHGMINIAGSSYHEIDFYQLDQRMDQPFILRGEVNSVELLSDPRLLSCDILERIAATWRTGRVPNCFASPNGASVVRPSCKESQRNEDLTACGEV